MSTDHQQYSIDNQNQVIRSYAEVAGLTIVKSYVDTGRSGLSIDRRDALQRMLEIVVSGRADFSTILVYDVSRWGRFQDVDEAAHYEFICRRAGVEVKYCAEQFGNDGSLPNIVFKGLKRAMAAEFSRELSIKVSDGMKRLAALGYFHGGIAPIGLRRLLIDEGGKPRMLLQRGQAKHLQTDRVVLVHGPEEELEIVRRIFRMFVMDRISREHIAKQFNREGVLNAWGNKWTHNNVLRVLRNELYIGRLTYNRTSRHLQGVTRRNPKVNWVVRDSIFDPVVDPALFAAAQSVLDHPWFYSDNELLDFLSATLCAQGKISSTIIRDMPGPSLTTYFHRFGRLSHTLRLIGYRGCRNNAYTGDPLYKAQKPQRQRPRCVTPWKHVAYRYRQPKSVDF